MSSMDKLKIKLISEKPKRVYATNIEKAFHLKDFLEFLKNTKEKKLDVVINGKLFTLATSAAKTKFIEGFALASDVVDSKPKKEEHNTSSVDELNKLKKANADLIIKQSSNVVGIQWWKNRVLELEATCEELKKIIDKK